MLMLCFTQNGTTNNPTMHFLAAATHDQLRLSGNLTYFQLYNTYTKAQTEADVNG
jgi:hypothetical protein